MFFITLIFGRLTLAWRTVARGLRSKGNDEASLDKRETKFKEIIPASGTLEVYKPQAICLFAVLKQYPEGVDCQGFISLSNRGTWGRGQCRDTLRALGHVCAVGYFKNSRAKVSLCKRVSLKDDRCSCRNQSCHLRLRNFDTLNLPSTVQRFRYLTSFQVHTQ